MAKETMRCIEREKWSPEDFLVSKEVIKANLPCVRCGKLAKTSANRNKELITGTALCLSCRVKWHDYNAMEVWDVSDKTHGLPARLFYMGVFTRFIKREPPLTIEEALKLLDECRRQARQKRGEEIIKKKL